MKYPFTTEVQNLSALHRIGHISDDPKIRQSCWGTLSNWIAEELGDLSTSELVTLRGTFRDDDDDVMERKELAPPRCSLTQEISKELSSRKDWPL
jgi:hypothetical protein